MPEDVLPAVAAGDSRAIEQCLDRYGGLVWSLARRYFGRQVDAEDAVQEAFLSLWENAHRYDPAVASESTFVSMICRRRVIDSVRKVSRSRDHVAQAVGGDTPLEEPADDNHPRIEHEGVELRGFEITEEVDRVRRQMQSLKDEEQRVLDLAICQGMSQSRVAEVTGWPLGTVKSHARRGMRRLRELLTNEPPHPDPTAAKEATR